MEIFTSATPIAAGLEAQAGIGTVEHTIVYIQVAYHTGRLASAGYGTVSLPGQAMTDYDIFGGAVYPHKPSSQRPAFSVKQSSPQLSVQYSTSTWRDDSMSMPSPLGIPTEETVMPRMTTVSQ